MYFWNVNALARDLKANTVSAYEVVKYYAFITAGAAIYWAFGGLLLPKSKEIYELGFQLRYLIFIVQISFAALSVCGLFYCYNVNAQGDNENFLSRFICLLLPTKIKFQVIYFIALFIFLFAILIVTGEMFDDYILNHYYIMWFTAISQFILYIFIYLYLGAKIRNVAGVGE